jgi:hypothetical protein
MMRVRIAAVGMVAMQFILSGCAITGGPPVADSAPRRAAATAAAETALDDLYRANPSAKSLVATAAGYAVFDVSGARREGAAAGRDDGVLVDNATKQRIYLAMVRPLQGYGVAYPMFRRVIVFQSAEALAAFRAAALSGAGGDASVVPAAAIVTFDLTPGGVVAVSGLGAARFAP